MTARMTPEGRERLLDMAKCEGDPDLMAALTEIAACWEDIAILRGQLAIAQGRVTPLDLEALDGDE